MRWLALLLLSSSAGASPWIEGHLLSNHGEDMYTYEGETHVYNERHQGVGVALPLTLHTEVGAGYFKNSYNIDSYYAGVDVHTSSRRGARIGVSVYLVDGYMDTPTPTFITALPNIVLATDNVRVKVGYMPVGVSVLTMSIGFRF